MTREEGLPAAGRVIPKESDNDLKGLYLLLRANLGPLLFWSFLCSLPGIAYFFYAPSVYASLAVVQVEQAAANLVNIQEVNVEDYRTLESLKTVQEALGSNNIMLRVIRVLKLDQDPSFATKEDGPWTDPALIRKLFHAVDIKLRRGTRLVDIEAQDRQPARAQKIAAAVVSEFLKEGLAQRLAVWKVANGMLLQEAQNLRNNLAQSEQTLQAYMEKHDAVSLQANQNIVVEKLRDLNFKVTAAKTERLRLEGDMAAVTAAKGGNPRELLTIAGVAGLPEIQGLLKQINDQEAELAGIKEQYLARNPKYVAGETRLRELTVARDRALESAGALLRQSYASARETETKFESALREQEKLALDLNKLSIDYDALRREVDSNRALYDSLLKRLKETDVNQSLDANFLRLVDPPLLPDRPKLLRKLIVLGGMIMLGLGIGTGRMLLDSTFASVDQTEELLGRPVWAVVPRRRRKRGGDLAILEDRDSSAAEAIRLLRATLSPTARLSERLSFAFTGAVPGEGATFCAVNFAAALAQQGLSVLLIDANLRDPRVHEVLGRQSPGGLSEVLAGARTLDQELVATQVPGLTLLSAGECPSNPGELLSGSRLAACLQEALTRFERVVVDTAPVNEVSDTLVAAPLCNVICLVIRLGRTTQDTVRRAFHLLELEHAEPTGVVLNFARQPHRSPARRSGERERNVARLAPAATLEGSA